ncbi:MAG: helix-turn-helix transcriptional regulator [Chloroflexi bacterium]|nr:helix-turn-helix transcriptional regulator [Chloroflexota bacterium]
MKLALYLKEHNLTSLAFGERINTSAESVRRYAKGLRTPRPTIMVKIVHATDGAVNPTDFLPPFKDKSEAA